MSQTTAIIGAGLVGFGWVIVFARAGHRVQVYERSAATCAQLPAMLTQRLKDLEAAGLVEDVRAIQDRVHVCATLEEALSGASYVQESVLERLDAKRAVLESIDALIEPGVPVGSSSSGIPASAFTEGLRHAAQYLVAHPVNPPYLHPLVELVPAPWTDEAVVERVRDLMVDVGQYPIRVHGEPEGFILNRLQGALLREAWALYEEGHASLEDIDTTVSSGLGLRWAFMGPFETIDLNAPGGVRDYAERLGPLYLSIARDRVDPQPWSEALIAGVEADRRKALSLEAIAERCAWRDRMLMALAAFKKQALEESTRADKIAGSAHRQTPDA